MSCNSHISAKEIGPQRFLKNEAQENDFATSTKYCPQNWVTQGLRVQQVSENV